jgi:hypothetical protein
VLDKVIDEFEVSVAESHEKNKPEIFPLSAQVMQEHGKRRFPDDKPDK